LDIPDYQALRTALKGRAIRQSMGLFALSMSGFVLIIVSTALPAEDLRYWLTIISIIIIMLGLVLGASIGLYLGGIHKAESLQQISESSYYSPGSRESITELRIEPDGIYLKLYDTDASGVGSGISHAFSKIPYDRVSAIFPVYIEYPFYSNRKQLAMLNIETDDRKLGHIDLIFHRGDIVLARLQRHLGDRWGEVFHENEAVAPFEMNRLRPER